MTVHCKYDREGLWKGAIPRCIYLNLCNYRPGEKGRQRESTAEDTVGEVAVMRVNSHAQVTEGVCSPDMTGNVGAMGDTSKLSTAPP